MTHFKELGDVASCMVAANLTLVLENGQTGGGEVEKGLEFRCFEGSSKQSVELSSHAC